MLSLTHRRSFVTISRLSDSNSDEIRWIKLVYILTCIEAFTFSLLGFLYVCSCRIMFRCSTKMMTRVMNGWFSCSRAHQPNRMTAHCRQQRTICVLRAWCCFMPLTQTSSHHILLVSLCVCMCVHAACRWALVECANTCTNGRVFCLVDVTWLIKPVSLER